MKAGTVWVNCYGLADTSMPFGGYKQSGFGRENGKYAIDLFTQIKSVSGEAVASAPPETICWQRSWRIFRSVAASKVILILKQQVLEETANRFSGVANLNFEYPQIR